MSKKKIVLIIVGVFFVFGIIGTLTGDNTIQTNNSGSNTNQTKAGSNESNQAKTQPSLEITSEVVRIGNRDIVSDYNRDFSYDTYNKSALTDIEATISAELAKDVIKVPFKDDVEVEITYKDLDLKEHGLFGGGSEFVITKDPNEGGGGKTSPRQGKLQSWKITNNRAIAHFAPWVYAPYGSGGIVKLEVILETKQGQKFNKEWTFQVGKNPEVYDKEFE